LLIENGCVVAVAVVAFLMVLWLSGGSLLAAFARLHPSPELAGPFGGHFVTGEDSICKSSPSSKEIVR
jgi:hypothetical protein